MDTCFDFFEHDELKPRLSTAEQQRILNQVWPQALAAAGAQAKRDGWQLGTDRRSLYLAIDCLNALLPPSMYAFLNTECKVAGGWMDSIKDVITADTVEDVDMHF